MASMEPRRVRIRDQRSSTGALYRRSCQDFDWRRADSRIDLRLIDRASFGAGKLEGYDLISNSATGSSR